jgi:hypothetical protein
MHKYSKIIYNCLACSDCIKFLLTLSKIETCLREGPTRTIVKAEGLWHKIWTVSTRQVQKIIASVVRIFTGLYVQFLISRPYKCDIKGFISTIWESYAAPQTCYIILYIIVSSCWMFFSFFVWCCPFSRIFHHQQAADFLWQGRIVLKGAV